MPVPAFTAFQAHPRAAALVRTAAVALALAAPVAAGAQDLNHTVVAGDSLYTLAQRYLDDPRQWRRLQTLNRVADPLRLRPGSVLVIPGAMLRPQPASAEVLHVAGPVSTRDEGATPGTSATPAVGQRLAEGTRVTVGDGGYLSLRLADGSIVRLPSGSAARLRELRHAPASGASEASVELERGRVDSTVAPLATPRSRFEVRTPLAVGGVRGTRFGVAVADDGDFIGDVTEGAVQVQRAAATTAPAAAAAALVRAGEGTRVAPGVDAPRVTLLLGAPDLSGLPAVVEDISFVTLPLPAAAGARAWQVRVTPPGEPEQVLRNATFAQPSARWPGLPDGRYQVAVRLLDERGIPGREAVREFEVNARPEAPLLREPREGSRLHGATLDLLCTEGLDVTGYRLQVARDRAFTDLVAQTADLPRCSHSLATPAPGAYFWRVAAVARDDQGRRDQGPFSPPAAFSIVALPPVPAAPSVQSGRGDGFAIEWAESAGGPWRHQMQIARDAGFTDRVRDLVLDAPRHAGAAPEPGTYFLRVRQIDPASGLEGAWTAPQRFEIASRIVTSDNQPLLDADGGQIRPGTR